jgi:hypothetical protein
MHGMCSKCGELKSLSPSNISVLTGERLHRTWCLDCEKKRKDDWRSLNKEKHNSKSKDWVKANPEKRKAAAKKWADNNYIVALEGRRNWRKNNLERSRSYVNARRSALKVATPKCLGEFDLLWIEEIYHLAQLRSLTVDHEIPLRHKRVCGLHVPWNLRLMDAHSNYSKSNSFEGIATR